MRCRHPSRPSPPPPLDHSFPKPTRCSQTAAECAASVCVLCVCCPLALLWRCLKLPCKLACRVARRGYHAVSAHSGQRFVASYSSFSDIDELDLDLRPNVEHLGCISRLRLYKERLIKVVPRRTSISSSSSSSQVFEDSGLKSFIRKIQR